MTLSLKNLGVLTSDRCTLISMSYEHLCRPELAVITDVMRRDVIKHLNMDGCKIVSVSPSPNKCNIFYRIEDDFSSIVNDLFVNAVKAKHVMLFPEHVFRSLCPLPLHIG